MPDGGEQLMTEAEELRSRLEMVSRQLDLLTNLKEDKTRAHETLQGLQSAKPGDEVLFPVGGNAFVAATLGKNDTVIKGVGADYAMQRPIGRAIEELKREVDTLDSDIQNLTQSAQQMEDRYQQIAQVLQQMGGPPQEE